ncbi:MAG: DUF1499 domain-containing protein [Caulobacterales bacterium]|uniref:DUF1499 domain-containing protein n=1 Tax=Glycocaulis sp. TaxID=1969725 RepID=UPI003FA079CB
MMGIVVTLRTIAVWLAGLAALIAPLWFAAAGLGSRAGLWDWRFGLGTMTREIGPNLLIAAVGLGVAALLLLIVTAIFAKENRASFGAWLAAVLAIAVGAGGLWYAASVAARAGEIPPIHDISTDTSNPPQFTATLIARRGEASNSVDYASKTDPRSGRPLPEVQAEAYPDIQPIAVAAEPLDAYQAALAVARDMGMTVSTESERELMFEATATTFWYGFRDDVVVRVTALTDGGSVVDARSVSRVGVSDLGANAARLRTFSASLQDRLGED